MKTAITSAAFLSLIGFVDLANAQYMFPGYWYGGFDSSTPYEAAARGDADSMRSYGQYLESEARAAQTWASVDRIDGNNRYETLATIRQERERARLDREARLSDTARRNAAFIAQKHTRPRLDPSSLGADGTIDWPTPLLDAKFDAQRAELDRLFNQRARRAYSSHDPKTRRAIEKVANTMKGELLGQIREMTPSDYVQSKKFVEALALEARLPMGSNLVAQSR